jgi:hypothetical protein
MTLLFLTSSPIAIAAEYKSSNGMPPLVAGPPVEYWVSIGMLFESEAARKLGTGTTPLGAKPWHPHRRVKLNDQVCACSMLTAERLRLPDCSPV